MNPLRQYLRDQKKTAAALARELGYSKSYICEVLNGRQKASLDLAVAIEAYTGGLVTCAAVLAFKSPPGSGSDDDKCPEGDKVAEGAPA